MQRRTPASIIINSMFWSTVLFVLTCCHVLTSMVRVIEGKIIQLFQKTLSAKAHLTRPQVVIGDFLVALPNSALAHLYRKPITGPKVYCMFSHPVVLPTVKLQWKYKISTATHTTFRSCHVSLGLYNPTMLIEIAVYKMTWKGKENWFELAGGSSYQGFELPRVKLQWMYHRNPGENDFGSS